MLFGLNASGRLVHVSEVARGLECGCSCCGCGEPLVAKRGSVREHHFAHQSGSADCEVAFESALHLYAKGLIEERQGLMVPPVWHGGGFPRTSDLWLQLEKVETEKWIDGIRPDVVGTGSDGAFVAIEVAHTSFCDEAKIEKFRTLQLPAMEVDLQRWTSANFDPAEVERVVIDSIEAKRWLWPGSQGMLSGQTQEPPPTGLLHEEIIDFSGNWVALKWFPDGGLAVKILRPTEALISMIRRVTRGRYNPKWKTWNVHRSRAKEVAQELKDLAQITTLAMVTTKG